MPETTGVEERGWKAHVCTLAVWLLWLIYIFLCKLCVCVCVCWVVTSLHVFNHLQKPNRLCCFLWFSALMDPMLLLSIYLSNVWPSVSHSSISCEFILTDIYISIFIIHSDMPVLKNVHKKCNKKAPDSLFVLFPQTVFMKVGLGQIHAWRISHVLFLGEK